MAECDSEVKARGEAGTHEYKVFYHESRYENSRSPVSFSVIPWPQYACMPVRKMVTGTRMCRTDDDCAAHSHAASVCVTPSLENQTRFIRVTHPPSPHMLFVGYPPHLQYAGTYAVLCSHFIFVKIKAARDFSVRHF